MQFKNTPYSYGLVTKSLHWIIALLIIAAWGVGYYMAELPQENVSRMALYNLHKSVGMAILLLVVIRLSWRLYEVKPFDEPAPRIFTFTAHVVHYCLYLLMFLQPLSGWAMSSAAGYTPTFFGMFSFPPLVAKNMAVVGFYREAHEFFAYALLVLIILHVAGALFHHFYFKDRTLRKMTID